jgi:parallel beta-helix repeat protein
VSLDGKDSWSGLYPFPNDAKTDGPFRTLDHAKLYVQKLKQREGKFKKNVTVSILPGIHHLDNPLYFTSEDSGDDDKPITYQSYSTTEKAVISACQNITTPWKEVPGTNFVRTVVPLSVYFTQLFVNGDRRPRARFPDRVYDRALNDSKLGFIFHGNDIDPNWQNLEDANLVMFHSWTASRHYIAKVVNKTVLFTNPTWFPAGQFAKQSGKRYYIENVYEALNSPGEWYLNRKTGELTYYPMPGETIPAIHACYPLHTRSIQFIGNFDADKFVQNIQFRNLSFQYSAWSLGRYEAADFQAATYTNSTIFMQDARRISFVNCDILHSGGYAIYMERGCTEIVVDSCNIQDMAAGGIRIGQTNVTKYITGNNHITNNVITNGGNVFREGVGVLIHKSSNNVVHNNTISYIYYTGVSVGWTWGYDPNSGAIKNMISNNYIHHIGMHQLNDMGGIYTLGISNQTVIRHNVIEDVHSYYNFDWGIYLDEGTSNVLVHDNIVRRTGSAGFFQHYGSNNLVRDNIFMNSDCRDGDVAMGEMEKHIGYYFVNNKVYHSCPNNPLIFTSYEGDASTSNYVFDYNRYYICTTETEPKIVLYTKNVTFAIWQQVFGQDKNSKLVFGC